MTSLDIQEVERHAQEVRERLGVGVAPIGDVTSALSDAGLVVLVRPLGTAGPDGLYVRRGDQGYVLLNGDAYLPRLRFTGAHELGHHEYGAHAVVDVTTVAGKDPDEQVANAFAASFLMPRDAVFQRIEGPTPTPDRLVELADEFGVSYPAFIFRLHNLGFLPGGAVERDRLLADPLAKFTSGFRQRHLEERSILPPDYVKRAVDAYRRYDISLDRLAELVFDNSIGGALQEEGLLHPEDA